MTMADIYDSMESTKKCNGSCGLIKNINEYPSYFDKRDNKFRRRGKCSNCYNECALNYYNNHKEEISNKITKKRAQNYIENINNPDIQKKIEILNKICGDCGFDKNIEEFCFDKCVNNYTTYCNDCRAHRSRVYYAENRVEILEKNNNDPFRKEKQRKRGRKYYFKNKTKIIAKSREKGKDPKVKKQRNILSSNSMKKRKNDPITGPTFKLRIAVSKNIRKALLAANGSKYGQSIMKFLPYAIEELRKHIESQFEPWMSWENYGPADINKKTWHLDHIIPQSVLIYNSMDHINFQKCWAFANLRPLNAIENVKKGDKINDELKIEISNKIDTELENRANNPEFKIILERLKLEELERNNKKAA